MRKGSKAGRRPGLNHKGGKMKKHVREKYLRQLREKK